MSDKQEQPQYFRGPSLPTVPGGLFTCTSLTVERSKQGTGLTEQKQISRVGAGLVPVSCTL